MAEKSLIEIISQAYVDAMLSALDGTNSQLPPLDPPDAAGARAALAALPARAKAVADATDLSAWVTAVGDWRAKAEEIADKAFGATDATEAALVRFVEERMPRTAALLALTGVFVHSPAGPGHVDPRRLRDLLTDPGTLVNESLWDALLGDTGIPGTGRLPAVLIALLLLAPQTVIALTRGEVTVAGLPAPQTDAQGPWRTFREASEGWVSLTVPLGDPARPTPLPGDIYDYAADLLPDLTATLGLRSQRLPKSGGGNRTVFELWLAVAVEGDRWQYDLGESWFLRVEPGLTAGFGYDGQWHGAFRQFALDPAHLPGSADPVEVTLGRERGPGVADIAIGPPYDTRLVIRDLGLFLRLREDHPVIELGAFVHGLSVVLTNRWWRTFGITSVLRDGIRFDLDLDIAYVEGKGIRLNLSSGLDITFAIDQEWGADGPIGLKLHTVRVRVPVEATQDSFDARIEARVHISVHLGPVTLVVDGLGGWLGYWTESGAKRYVGFLPPTGAGLQISAGIFTGGGFLDFTGGPNERFGGLLSIKIGAFEVTVFGLHELTGQPGEADRRTSLVMVLGVRFAPGIQLGFGFEISGFGGLVGINRRADTDALRERLTSGAAGNVLFAEDPVRNAPRILGDLGALFPAHPGSHVFGPTVQLSWLNLAGAKVFKIDVGIFLEFPGPTRIVLLGSVRAQVPPVKDVPHLVDVRFDVVGFIDFPQKIIEFDATLIDSSIMEAFHLTGDIAFRIAWGDHPYLLLSFGGFHPRFQPRPAQFPDLTRLALTVKPGFFSKGLFFRAECYLAVTSNTVQFGGLVELGYAVGPLNLTGSIGLDALIQFSPFYFNVSVSTGVRLRWNSTRIAGVRLEGILSGPGPLSLTGRACFEILWFDICADVTIALGSSSAPASPAASSVVLTLSAELRDAANLAPVGGDDALVVQRPRPSAASDHPLVSPLGALRWTQKRAPLNLLLDRFEGEPLAASQAVAVECALAGGTAVDWFAPGSFADLSESESLSRPGFERLDAGIDIGFGSQAVSASIVHPVTVIEVRLPNSPVPGAQVLPLSAVTLAAIRARSAAAAVRTTAPVIGVEDERLAVRGQDGTLLADGLRASEAHQRARRLGAVPVHSRDLVDLGDF